jgi:hypothetical protein
MAVVCGAAFWKGDREEQVTAGALLLGWVATLVLRDPRWLGIQWGGFAVDGLFMVMITIIALRSRRYWPLAAAGFQLLAIVTHAARMVDPSLGGWVYATAGIVWTQLLILSLATGVWGTWRAQRYPAATEDAADSGLTRR